MNWRRTLQTKTRQPQFLWRMVISIICVGIVVGLCVQPVSEPTDEVESVLVENSPWVDLNQLAAQGKWAELWWAIPGAEWWQSRSLGPVALAALTGACWFCFALQAVQPSGWRDPRLWLAPAGVCLGVLSIWPTLFLIYWHEYVWGLEESRSLAAGLRFYVLGVGLREEFSKLLCLLPLMPLLLRMRSELVALLVSGCVGIGFALEENADYFVSSGGGDVMGRYLTANPFHMTATAVVGLAVYRAFRNPRDWGLHAVAIFGMIVFAHGMYDAFIALPDLAEYSILGTIVFALVVYQFFGELRDTRARRPETVSLTANFLFGVSLVTAATFVYLSASGGSLVAIDVLATEVLGLGVMVYLFLREMPETMVIV